MSSSATYTKVELLRTFRNRRFFVFSLVFPLLLFYLIAGPNQHERLGGLPLPLYFMVGMTSFGTMTAVMAGGARIAAERQAGWNRQLRITPLSPVAYFRVKVLTGYAMALLSIALLYGAGLSLGVRLGATQWLAMTGLILAGLIPFAALGVLLGHLLTVDSMGPALGGITALFAIIGGSWGPIADSGFLHAIGQGVPAYWIVQAGQVAEGGDAWPARAWLVIAIWTVVLTRLARMAYQRDTKRV